MQKSIKRAMKESKSPFYIFRGVNTYEDIGKFLGKLGIKMSTLKAFKDIKTKATEECEHDILFLALLPTGPLVSFVQVDL